MPSATPSKSRIENVLTAMIGAGLKPGAIRVMADGSFVVETEESEALDQRGQTAQGEPRKFGQAR